MFVSVSDLYNHPELVVLVPFAWWIWQAYAPRIIPGYETWWTNTRQNFMAEMANIDNRIDSIGNDVSNIADTQEQLVHITIAQSYEMNGHDVELDIESVEEDLLDKKQKSARDYLNNNNE